MEKAATMTQSNRKLWEEDLVHLPVVLSGALRRADRHLCELEELAGHGEVDARKRRLLEELACVALRKGFFEVVLALGETHGRGLVREKNTLIAQMKRALDIFEEGGLPSQALVKRYKLMTEVPLAVLLNTDPQDLFRVVDTVSQAPAYAIARP